jgi:hypothetical protein
VTIFDRLTRPLAPVDRPINALNDGTARVTPWVWWPASAPRRNRPWSTGQHVAYAGWALAGLVVGEIVAARLPAGLRSTGAQLRNDRIRAGLAGLVGWVIVAGAWDRRATRLRRRRPWLRG